MICWHNWPDSARPACAMRRLTPWPRPNRITTRPRPAGGQCEAGGPGRSHPPADRKRFARRVSGCPDSDRRRPVAVHWFYPEPKSFQAAGLNDSLIESLSLKLLAGPRRLHRPRRGRPAQAAFHPHRRAAPRTEERPVARLSRQRADERLPLPAYRSGANGPSGTGATAPTSAPPRFRWKTISRASRPNRSPRNRPRPRSLRQAFGDLVLSQRMLDRLGPAVNSGRGLFLFGAAGNGKTSIAERVTRAFGQEIWIPRAIGIDGEIMRVFDPVEPRRASAGGLRGPVRQAEDRPPLGADPPAHADRRRRADDVGPGSDDERLDRHLRIAAATEEQLRHAGDRRLRPAADADRGTAQSLDRPAGTALRLPQHAQRQEDRGAVRPVDHLLDEPGAARPGRRGILAADPLQDRGARPEPRGFQGAVLSLAKKMGFPDRPEAVERLIRQHYAPKNRPFRFAIPATSSCRSAITAATRIARWRSPTSTSIWRWKTISP